MTDSLSLRLRKLVYCRQQSLMKMLAISMRNHPVHPLPQPHYFHTLLIPSQELTFPYKPVSQLDFHSKFSIIIYYSNHSLPICFKVPPSYHRIWSPIKLRSNTVLSHFGIRPQQQHKDKDMRLECLPIVHQSWMVRFFLYILDFSQSNDTFYRISVFFKHNWFG